jgi:hypothetical protein
MHRGFLMLSGLILAAGLLVSCESGSDRKPREKAPHGPGTIVPAKPKVPSAPVSFQDGFERVRIEAESAAKLEGGLMRVVDDPEASGGKCLEIPDKIGKPEDGKLARAVYKFTVKVSDNYTFWCRRKWYDQCGDTLAVRFDSEGQPHDKAFLFGADDSSKPPRWGWSPVFQNGKPRQFLLTAGEHTMEILNREDGPRFDVYLLTNDRDCVPQGLEE